MLRIHLKRDPFAERVILELQRIVAAQRQLHAAFACQRTVTGAGLAYFVPAAPALSPAGAIQLNDVYVDERRIVYTVDRFAGGLYILEMTL